MKLSSCLAYLMRGSVTADPDRTCCDGLSNVLATDNGAVCLCGAFIDRAGLSGVQLNDTRALSLPTDCFVTNYPSAANCSCKFSSPCFSIYIYVHLV
ncbi:non-specific lipid-transfer protein-like protein at5g64080 [Phtheirospermum japonicum]|uniref:Non-specific lipid-transfer protein-like protein at5g64080 n=1 Tax=Phtheirospermum japonicum TaxID=374723 RepID=A0A830BSS8_9LAMI|nr:non-specific lipid-transfer protein-like protein at5g64080 [Phtheirospermum japonicum]